MEAWQYYPKTHTHIVKQKHEKIFPNFELLKHTEMYLAEHMVKLFSMWKRKDTFNNNITFFL